eukprot:g28900.t1
MFVERQVASQVCQLPTSNSVSNSAPRRYQPQTMEPARDRLTEAQSKVDQVKGLAMQNIESAIERGERLDELDNKANRLQEEAGKFKHQSTQVKRRMQLEAWKAGMLIFLLLQKSPSHPEGVGILKPDDG